MMSAINPAFQPAAKRIKSFQETALGFAKKPMVEEAVRCPQCHDSPCGHGCPLGIDVPGFIRLLREGDVAGALNKIREHNDLPGVCGRVCLAPCEKACVLNAHKEPINIRSLERYASDNGRPRFQTRRAVIPTGKKVAVVGSGPAGLTAASRLAKAGLKVTVYEALPLLGGVLRYGIPEFRLPKNVLDAEIEEIRLLGVEFKTNFLIGQSQKVEQLLREGFSAVLLTVGKSHPQFSDLPGADLSGVYYAREILLAANTRYESVFRKDPHPQLGPKVAVLGKGAIALDCARICLRLGREVTMVLPDTLEDLKAHSHERDQAQQEGLKFEALAQAQEILAGPDGHVIGVKCVRMDFADADGKGTWVLKPVPGSEFVVEAGSVILSTGSKVAAAGPVSGFKINDNGTVWVDPHTGMTSIKNIFAAGDAAQPMSQLAQAMASAKHAAALVINALK